MLLHCVAIETESQPLLMLTVCSAQPSWIVDAFRLQYENMEKSNSMQKIKGSQGDTWVLCEKYSCPISSLKKFIDI